MSLPAVLCMFFFCKSTWLVTVGGLRLKLILAPLAMPVRDSHRLWISIFKVSILIVYFGQEMAVFL